MLLIPLKIGVTAGIVLGLAWLSERVSPRVAGIVAGLPLGTSITLFFLGLEQGPGFASAASVAALAGVAAMLAMLAAYALLARRWGPLASALGAQPVFLATAWGLSLLPRDRWLLLAIVAVLALAMIPIFRRDRVPGALAAVRITAAVLLARAGTAAAIVLLITGVAASIGETWAGLLSGYPMTLFPLMLIVHVTYGAAPARAIVASFPYGVGSLTLFVFCCGFLLEPWGLWWGMAGALAAAVTYLAAIGLLLRRRQRRPPALPPAS